MAGEKRTWVRQVFMNRSFIRSRTTAICDCWLDPIAGACSGFWEATPNPELAQLRHQVQSLANSRYRLAACFFSSWLFSNSSRNLSMIFR